MPTKVGTYQQQANVQIIDPAGHRRAVALVGANLGWHAVAGVMNADGLCQQRLAPTNNRPTLRSLIRRAIAGPLLWWVPT
ncbi:hypothetical protein, partial [Stenotrophomonas sp.]|uniref:hypothetical protein n=1 Tax=Stenotrophomonas sp. TaxID=69392 RepID=UPI0028AC10F0